MANRSGSNQTRLTGARTVRRPSASASAGNRIIRGLRLSSSYSTVERLIGRAPGCSCLEHPLAPFAPFDLLRLLRLLHLLRLLQLLQLLRFLHLLHPWHLLHLLHHWHLLHDSCTPPKRSALRRRSNQRASSAVISFAGPPAAATSASVVPANVLMHRVEHMPIATQPSQPPNGSA